MLQVSELSLSVCVKPFPFCLCGAKGHKHTLVKGNLVSLPGLSGSVVSLVHGAVVLLCHHGINLNEWVGHLLVR